MAAERPPADLKGVKALRLERQQVLGERPRLVHQQRGIGPHPLAVAPAQQPPDGLAGGLAEEIPEGDVDAADRVGDRAAAALPEGVLVQYLADPLGLQRALAAIERLEHRQRAAHQILAGEDAAQAIQLRIGQHGDERVDGLLSSSSLLQPPSGRPAAQPPRRGSREFHIPLSYVARLAYHCGTTPRQASNEHEAQAFEQDIRCSSSTGTTGKPASCTRRYLTQALQFQHRWNAQTCIPEHVLVHADAADHRPPHVYGPRGTKGRRCSPRARSTPHPARWRSSKRRSPSSTAPSRHPLVHEVRPPDPGSSSNLRSLRLLGFIGELDEPQADQVGRLHRRRSIPSSTWWQTETAPS